MDAQLSIFNTTVPVKHRKRNGQYATRLESALQESLNWKTLYLCEIRKDAAISRTLRAKDEEIIRLKNLLTIKI